MTCSEAVEVVTAIVVAPVIRTVRNITTEIALGPDDGLSIDCVDLFENLQRVRRSALTERAGSLDGRRHQICQALMAFADC